jgi:3-phenylpropionate/trans-cinnamate dioxygenase ferredoxin subunit
VCAETSEIPSGQTKAFKIEEKEILITNVSGACYAIGNICTHMGGDLSKGTLEGNVVTCPKHRAKLDVTTVRVVSGLKMSLMHQKTQEKPTAP